MCYYYYFASAAVAVDSSHTTAPLSTSRSWPSPPAKSVNGHALTKWTMARRWSQTQEGDRVRPHPCKPAPHGPRPARKRPTRDRWGRMKPRASNNSAVDHRNRWPVTPLHNLCFTTLLFVVSVWRWICVCWVGITLTNMYLKLPINFWPAILTPFLLLLAAPRSSLLFSKMVSFLGWVIIILNGDSGCGW